MRTSSQALTFEASICTLNSHFFPSVCSVIYAAWIFVGHLTWVIPSALSVFMFFPSFAHAICLLLCSPAEHFGKGNWLHPLLDLITVHIFSMGFCLRWYSVKETLLSTELSLLDQCLLNDIRSAPTGNISRVQTCFPFCCIERKLWSLSLSIGRRQVNIITVASRG